ncbi:surfeit locus protein 1-like [Salvia hispanica]|uniref:surfeit locus protein 1-like n=1 Tax=Salvia hispanica TaxID=49212 RepID=UPI0020096201|nr:surfeit locus protein 1-like [Salvia hispanica]
MIGARNLRWFGLRRRLSTSPNSATSSHSQEKWRLEEWWILIPTGLFGVAAWNFFRARAKEKVHKYREGRLKLEALQGNRIYTERQSLDSVEFRRVVCRGVYDHKNSILVHKYIKINSGYWKYGYNLLTPLHPIPNDPQSIQSAILVNRGWVPLAWGKQALGREEESVELVGVISKGERPNTLWRSNNPAKSEWFTVDVPSLAHACGLPETTLHVVEIDSSSKMNTRKPYPFAFLACQVKEIYLSQLEHARYSALGFFSGCSAMAAGLKKFGKP